MKKENLFKISKILVLVFMSLTFLNILLPDEFIIDLVDLRELYGEDYRSNPFLMIMRWLNFVGFVTVPIAVFFDKSTFKKISIYFCLPVTIVFLCLYSKILPGYVSHNGTGIVDIRYLPDFVVNFMHSPVFRSVVFFATGLAEIGAIVLLIVRDPQCWKFKKSDIKNFVIILPLLIATIVPVYSLEAIFNTDTNIPFTFMSPAHIIWILFMVLEIIVIYQIFKKKSYEDKYIILLILALSLFVQYNQLFSSLGELTCKRMPLQLCNLAAYLTLIGLVTKNREVFLFNLLLNVAGAVIAIVVLDSANSGILGDGNVHYILEHNNVFVVPILTILLGVFEPLKKNEFKVFMKWFTIYFVGILVLGTLFNTLAVTTGSDYFYCNYLFMFDPEKGEKLVGFSKYLFDIKLNIGDVTLYPVIQGLIYIVMSLIGYLTFVIFRNAVKEKSLADEDVPA